MSRSVRILVHGRVQGVWYRAWAVREAQALGLDGWVRNRVDGCVEAVLRGPEAAVAQMIERCREGPPAARVTRIDEQPEPGSIAPGFHQAPTV